ncbi:GcrA family cell cycle regulator [Lacticaseibacillus rhamnosus]|uniref:GcrA family cell cycle regulator n=1 Tax=Lacticaseibacillus rhamnosus TaxID=47715 RepID=UPI00240D195F|nr:GcrA family cell cycle regulator [Lacticaseibacillus rhamnosus]
MQWTDEQIGDIRKLASEGFTRRETADKLGISYDALQGKARRLGIEFQKPAKNEYDSAKTDRNSKPVDRKVALNADGSQTVTALMRLKHEPNKDPRTLMELCGYDPDKFEMVLGDYKVYEQHSTEDGTVPQYSIHIRVKPKQGLSINEMAEAFNDKIIPVNYGMKKSGDRNLVIPLPDLHFGWTTFADLKDMVSQLREIIMIPLAIEYSNRVSIKSVFGNHSGDLEYAFLYALIDRYPQVHVDLNDSNPATDWRCAYLLGHVGIMLAHGDVAKDKLTGLFPFEYKKIFNMAKTYELHSGHYHSERFKDDRGIMWRQLGTAKPNDPYEIKNGFTTGKHLLYAFVYDDERLRCTYELN